MKSVIGFFDFIIRGIFKYIILIFCIFAVFIYFWHFTQEPQGHNSAGGISEALDSVNPYAAMAYPELSSELKGDGAEEFRKGAEFYASGDYDNACKEFLKAADKGFAPAEFNAGCFYFAGKCVKQDFDKADNFFANSEELYSEYGYSF